jgi:hypothetical protein
MAFARLDVVVAVNATPMPVLTLAPMRVPVPVLAPMRVPVPVPVFMIGDDGRDRT